MPLSTPLKHFIFCTFTSHLLSFTVVTVFYCLFISATTTATLQLYFAVLFVQKLSFLLQTFFAKTHF